MSAPYTSGSADLQRNVGGAKRAPKSGPTTPKVVRSTPITTANWRNVIWEWFPPPPHGGVISVFQLEDYRPLYVTVLIRALFANSLCSYLLDVDDVSFN